MSVQVPLSNAPYLSINGMQLTWLTGTTMSVNVGHCQDSTNVNTIYNFGNNIGTGTQIQTLPLPVAAPITINTAVQGAGGLDQGTLAATTFYAVYAIGSSTEFVPTSALLSLSATAPLLPYNYDMFRRIGYVLTSGVPGILKFWQESSVFSSDRKMWYDAPIVVLAATAAAAFTAQVLTAAVPLAVGQTNVTLQVDLFPNAAADFVEIRPTGGAAAGGNVKMSGDVAAVHHFDQIECICGVTVAPALSIDWITDAASTVALTVSAYVDHL